MTDEELKNKCKERAKIFQQAMESCKSSSPMDCIEWFADRIAELEKENADLKEEINKIAFARGTLEEENAELKKVAEFQQSSNMNRHFENKKLKEGLTVGSMWNKHLNSQNKALEEERDRYRNMTFDQREQLTKAKELLEKLLLVSCNSEVLIQYPNCSKVLQARVEAEQFLTEMEK